MFSTRLPKENIKTECPQCGSPIKFPDGCHSVRCSYCAKVLLITSPNRVLRFYLNTEMDSRSAKFFAEGYCKREGLPLPKYFDPPSLVYVPFWRFNGLHFELHIKRDIYEFEDGSRLEAGAKIDINSRPFDVSFLASNMFQFNDLSLGIRAQTLELCPELPEDLQGLARVVKPDIVLDTAREMAYESINKMNRESSASYEELIGERLTLVYFPLWISHIVNSAGKFCLLIDGVAKRVISHFEGEFKRVIDNGGFEGVGSIKLNPHHCPNCGADLPINGESFVFLCHNCNRIWYLEVSQLQQIEATAAKYDGPKDGRYYPFWRFEAIFSDKDSLLTFQQAKALFANKLSVLIDEPSDSIFRFYIPAFGVRNPGSIWVLASNLTRSQPDIKFGNSLPDHTVACSLPQEEAAQLARVLWFYLILGSAGRTFGKKLKTDDMPEIHFRPGHLIYFPMEEEGIYLREQTTGFAVQRRGVS